MPRTYKHVDRVPFEFAEFAEKLPPKQHALFALRVKQYRDRVVRECVVRSDDGAHENAEQDANLPDIPADVLRRHLESGKTLAEIFAAEEIAAVKDLHGAQYNEDMRTVIRAYAKKNKAGMIAAYESKSKKK
jgi:hypothetical protein